MASNKDSTGGGKSPAAHSPTRAPSSGAWRGSRSATGRCAVFYSATNCAKAESNGNGTATNGAPRSRATARICCAHTHSAGSGPCGWPGQSDPAALWAAYIQLAPSLPLSRASRPWPPARLSCACHRRSIHRSRGRVPHLEKRDQSAPHLALERIARRSPHPGRVPRLRDVGVTEKTRRPARPEPHAPAGAHPPLRLRSGHPLRAIVMVDVEFDTRDGRRLTPPHAAPHHRARKRTSRPAPAARLDPARTTASPHPRNSATCRLKAERRTILCGRPLPQKSPGVSDRRPRGRKKCERSAGAEAVPYVIGGSVAK